MIETGETSQCGIGFAGVQFFSVKHASQCDQPGLIAVDGMSCSVSSRGHARHRFLQHGRSPAGLRAPIVRLAQSSASILERQKCPGGAEHESARRQVTAQRQRQQAGAMRRTIAR